MGRYAVEGFVQWYAQAAGGGPTQGNGQAKAEFWADPGFVVEGAVMALERATNIVGMPKGVIQHMIVAVVIQKITPCNSKEVF